MKQIEYEEILTVTTMSPHPQGKHKKYATPQSWTSIYKYTFFFFFFLQFQTILLFKKEV